MQQILEWLLAQLTSRVGQIDTADALGIGIAGGTLLTVIVSWAGKLAIRRFMAWWNGDGLPLREFLAALLAKMGEAHLWGRETSDRESTVNARAKLRITPQAVFVDGADVTLTLNRRERGLVKTAHRALLKRIDQLKVEMAKLAAEQSLRNVLGAVT